MPHHTLSGTLSIRELVADWQQSQPTQPQLWLDLGQYRLDWTLSVENWYFSQGTHWLLSQPWLQPLPVPNMALPEVKVAFPTIHLEFPVPRWPAHEILTTTTRLAYGISLASFLFFLGPIILLESQRAWENVQGHLGRSRIYSAEVPSFSGADTTSPTPEPYASTPEDVFSLRVPDLDIESIVVPNVDSTDAESYTTALQEGIAHAAGSAFPDQLEENKTIYMFAHSTDATWNIARYNAQFYALKDAEIGQKVYMRFWNKDYTYRITEKKIVAADDTSSMAPQNEKSQLILQTCYPPGTTWKRLLIIAVPEEEYEEPQEQEAHNTSIEDMDKDSPAQYNTQTV